MSGNWVPNPAQKLIDTALAARSARVVTGKSQHSPAPVLRDSPSRRLCDSLSRPLLDLRLSVIDACNYRCGYCMPADTTYRFFHPEERLSFAELERLARIFGELGAVRLRITGGEPLLRPELPELIQRLADLPNLADLALTTNGELLAEQAADLARAGLRRLTVSLDSLNHRVFRQLSGGRGDLSRVRHGIDAAIGAGLRPIKLNTVVQKGVNDRPQDLLALVAFARERDLPLRFIEYMDAGNRNGWRPAQVVSSAELLELLRAAGLELVPQSFAEFGETARRYRFADGPGELGFISSVSAPFCGGCTRARISAEGRLYTCLFAGEGRDLRALLRGGADDAALKDAIAQTWRARRERYSEERFRQEQGAQKVEMFRIGG